MSLGLFNDWPTGRSPREIGKRVAENFVARKLTFEVGLEPVHYREACAWYGALTYAALAGDADLDRRLIEKFEPLLKPAGAAYHPARAHVDDRVFGITPLEIFLHGKDNRHLSLGKGLADAQWGATTPDGITSEARYWVDDMFMITALQVQAFRATKDATYVDRAAETLSAYLDRLQQPSGLFFHTLSSPVYWGRGNGWVAAGMTELLRSLSSDHPRRKRILDGYRKMMAALLTYQTPEGVWRQVLDNTGSWVETSGSAMFAFAFVSGVTNGWLDQPAYGPAARAAWLGVIEYLNTDANLREVCVGTGEAKTVVGSDPTAQLQYYLDRQRIAGDLHGQAPILWCASALLR
jgi:rhamnogalacturonyl hydrolase YesR